MKRKIDHLEGLRGLAALVVVLNHFAYGFYPALMTANQQQLHTRIGTEILFAQTPLNIFYNGHFAVCIFFVLSAYVLSYKYFQSGDNAIIISSALRRYFRLEIPILAAMIFSWALLQLNLYFNKEVGQITVSDWLVSFWNFAPSFTGMLKQSLWDVFINNQYTYDAVLWTMQYEFYGSFLVFSFCLLAGKIHNRLWIYIVLIAIFYDTLYLAFLFGLMLSDWYNSSKVITKPKIPSIVIFFGGIIAILLGSYQDTGGRLFALLSLQGIYKFNFLTFYHSIGAGVLVWVVVESTKLQHILSHRLCTYLGRISFPLYLLHFPILGSLSCFIFKQMMIWQHSYKVGFFITFALSIPIMIIVADWMSTYIDQPSLRWSDSMKKRFFQ